LTSENSSEKNKMKIKTFKFNLINRMAFYDAPERLDEMVRKDLGTKIKIHNVKDSIMKYPPLNEYIHQRIVIYDEE